MRFVFTLVIALLLLCVESVAVQTLGFTVTRVDATLALVVFLGLRERTAEGAFTAFCVGYLLDVFSGRPTGLYPFLAVLTFLGVKLLASFVDGRSRLPFAAMAGAATLVHALLAIFFTSLTSIEGGNFTALSSVPLQGLLAGLVAFLLWPLLLKLDPGTDRPSTGVLL